MFEFMGKDFLLESETAKHLYHDYAAKLPIIDYHCHINPYEISAETKFETITQVWLGGDHYKWRAMRAMGVDEKFITGNGSDREKFRAWAKTVPMLIGNPLYHWTHLELQRYFGIHETLCEENADEIYDKCNDILRQDKMGVLGLIERSGVSVICTTDDPTDTLSAHDEIAASGKSAAKVYPAFRPDKAINVHQRGFADYIKKLESLCGFEINKISDLQKALSKRMDFFEQRKCKVSDHALETLIYREASETELDRILNNAKMGTAASIEETEAFQTAMLLFFAKEYHKRDWVMQLHFGCVRNNSTLMFEALGADTGYDAMNISSNPRKLISFFDALEKQACLPKTILYSLNPLDNEAILSVIGCFQTNKKTPGYIQLGSAWWFNDHIEGMEKQMKDLASIGVLGSFVGMLTDSRSFLSYPRHEYFRRILCGLIGSWVEKGMYPNDEKSLKRIVEGICYYNAESYFGFE